jgi:hypothetical protein
VGVGWGGGFRVGGGDGGVIFKFRLAGRVWNLKFTIFFESPINYVRSRLEHGALNQRRA